MILGWVIQPLNDDVDKKIETHDESYLAGSLPSDHNVPRPLVITQQTGGHRYHRIIKPSKSKHGNLYLPYLDLSCLKEHLDPEMLHEPSCGPIIHETIQKHHHPCAVTWSLIFTDNDWPLKMGWVIDTLGTIEEIYNKSININRKTSTILTSLNSTVGSIIVTFHDRDVFDPNFGTHYTAIPDDDVSQQNTPRRDISVKLLMEPNYGLSFRKHIEGEYNKTHCYWTMLGPYGPPESDQDKPEEERPPQGRKLTP